MTTKLPEYDLLELCMFQEPMARFYLSKSWIKKALKVKSWGEIKIMKDNIIYAERLLGGKLYEVMLNIIPSKENVMTSVKRDGSSTDLSTWHRQLGHIWEIMLKRMINSEVVKGMMVTDMTPSGMCEDCILGKMDEKTFSSREEQDTQLFETLHADLIKPINPKVRWTHARFCLTVDDDCSGFRFTFHLWYKERLLKLQSIWIKQSRTSFKRGC